MSNKLKITEVIRESLPKHSIFKNLDIQYLLFRWWQTGRQGNNLRLTEEGKSAFMEADIAFYDFPLDIKKMSKKEITGKEYTLLLGKKIKCPFYIGLKTNHAKSAYIRIYESKVAMMITLYGSFDEFFDNAGIKND